MPFLPLSPLNVVQVHWSYTDVNGDGRITSMDMLYIKRHILYIKTLSGAYLLAADTNKDSDVTSMDMLYIKRHILDIKYIQQ